MPDAFTGTVTFTYTVEVDGAGCSDFVTETIEITKPEIDLGADKTATYADLMGGSVLLFDASTPTGIPSYTYSWAPNGETTFALVPADFGQYSVDVTEGFCTVSDDIWVYQDQQIALRTGWGIWSTLIDVNSITGSIDIEDVTANGGLTGIIIMKRDDGEVYWPTAPGAPNGIGDIENGEAYQYKMTAGQTLSVIGLPLNPAATPISLDVTGSGSAGYSMVGYLRQMNSSVAFELASIVSYIDIFKDQDGKVFWPAFNIDLIGDLMPGQGYKVKVNAMGQFLNYSANGPSATSKSDATMDVQFYSEVSKSNNQHHQLQQYK